MVNWQDPTVISDQLWASVKLTLTISGIYVWEIATSLDFDWYLLWRKDAGYSRYVKWIYLSTRYLQLAWVSVAFAAFSGRSSMSCRTTFHVLLGLVLIAYELMSTLIAVRTIAIWGKDIRVAALTGGALLAELIASVRDIILVDSVPGSEPGTCIFTNESVHILAINLTVVVACDVTLFSLMLAGLFRRRVASGYGFWLFLWRQGLIWFAVATLAELQGTIFLYLNLNPAMNELPVFPKSFALMIGGQRMYRSLSNFAENYSPATLPDISATRVGTDQDDSIAMVPLQVNVTHTYERRTDDGMGGSEFVPGLTGSYGAGDRKLPNIRE